MIETALTLAALLVVVFICWTAIRAWGRERLALYILIPALILFALGTKAGIDRLTGYATDDLSDLEAEFAYLHHSGHDPIFLLALPSGASEPRLYAIPRDMLSEQERRGLTAAGAKAAQGVPMLGTFSEGEARFYEFDVQRLAPKEP